MTTECTEPEKAPTLETLPERTKARAHTVAICLADSRFKLTF